MASGKAGRVDAGRAAQRVHGKARIIGDNPVGGKAAIVLRLEAGIGLEGIAGFVNRGQGSETREDLETQGGLHALKIGDFAGITGGEIERHAKRGSARWSRSCCMAMMRPIPSRPSRSSSRDCSSLKASCSAVAWISTYRPSPVMTRFMSTSARESSS